MESLQNLDPKSFVTHPLEGGRIGLYRGPARLAIDAIVAVLPPLSLETGPFIAGGALVRASVGFPSVEDVDVFCLTTEQFQLVFDHLTSQGFYSGEREATDSMGEQAILANFDVNGQKVQIIDLEAQGLPCADAREVLVGFDLTAAMIATDGKTVLMHDESAISIAHQKLVLNESEWRKRVLDIAPHLAKNAKRIAKYSAILETYLNA